jgi:hypothetical protein
MAPPWSALAQAAEGAIVTHDMPAASVVVGAVSLNLNSRETSLFFSVDVQSNFFVAIQDSDIALCRSNDNILSGPGQPEFFRKVDFECKDRAFHRHFHILHLCASISV